MINRSTGDLVCDTCRHYPSDPSRGIVGKRPAIRLNNHLKLTAAQIRKLARGEGWRRDGSLDRCPSCAAGMPSGPLPAASSKCDHGSDRGTCAICDFGVGEGVPRADVDAAHRRARSRVLDAPAPAVAPAAVPGILSDAQVQVLIDVQKTPETAIGGWRDTPGGGAARSVRWLADHGLMELTPLGQRCRLTREGLEVVARQLLDMIAARAPLTGGR